MKNTLVRRRKKRMAQLKFNTGNRSILLTCSRTLARHLDSTQLSTSLVLIDFGDIELKQSEVLVGLDIGFNRIAVRRSDIAGRQSTYWIGTMGARVTVTLDEGRLGKTFTDETTINVTYEDLENKTHSLGMSLTPSFKASYSGASTEVSGSGTLNAGIGATKATKTQFRIDERIVQYRHHPPAFAEWSLMHPQTARIVNAFLFGNARLLFSVIAGAKARGMVRVIPNEFEYFDPEGRRLGLFKSVVLRYVMAARKLQIMNVEGAAAQFQVEIAR